MKLSVLFFFLFFPLTHNFTGKVIAVLDGDTIEVLSSNNTKIRIRLNGIDCPEKNQAYGHAAKQFTAALCFNKNVKVIGYNNDRYGRLIADIILPENQSLNELLIQNGYAWHYKKYSSDSTLAALEREAKANKFGLWTDPAPIAPWDFRRKNN